MEGEVKSDIFRESDLGIIVNRIKSIEESRGPKDAYDICICLAIFYLISHETRSVNPDDPFKNLIVADAYLNTATDIADRHKDMLSKEDVSMYGIIRTKINEKLDKMDQDSIAKYCDNDVLATEAVFNATQRSDA